MNFEEAKLKLAKYGQTHVLDNYDELTPEQKEALLKQIEETDFSVIRYAANPHGNQTRGKISPLGAMEIPEIEKNRERFEEAGLEALRAGKIGAVLLAGGIPILAHPVYGNGEQHITGTALRERFRYLIAYGLQGVEAFYTGLSPALTQEVLDLAQQYDLYVTAGSDYHGTNKTVLLGSVPLPDPSEYPQGLKNFLSRIYHP